MKSAEYVALVTGVYRAALDRAAESPDTYQVRDGELAVLGESFSRGFSEAYLVGERGNDMMSYQRPNNRGVPVGRVSATASGRATISLDAPIESRDTIEFWTSAGRFAQPAGPLEYAGAEHPSAPSGVKATVAVERSVTTGDRVFRVRNAALTDAAQRTFEEHAIAIPLAFEVGLVVGAAAARDGHRPERPVRHRPGRRCRTRAHQSRHRRGGRRAHRPARRHAVHGRGLGSHDVSRRRHRVLGAAPRSPRSARGLRGPRPRAVVGPQRPRRRSSIGRRTGRAPKRRRPLIVAVAADAETAAACLAAGADRVHVSVEALSRSAQPEPGIVPLLPRIAHDADVPGQLALVRAGRAGRRRQPGRARRGRPARGDRGGALVAERGEPRSPWRSSPSWAPRRSGCLRSSPGGRSPPSRRRSNVQLGTAVWGAQEIMVTEHCALMAEGPCTRACATCERRASERLLRDRKGYLFPVRTDVWGRSHVYNSVTLDLVPSLAEVLDSGVGALRLDLQLEHPARGRQAGQARSSRRSRPQARARSSPPMPPQPDRPRRGTSSADWSSGATGSGYAA